MPEKKVEELNNPFWKDLLRSWIMFCNNAKIQTLEDVLFSPLWYNSNFQHANYIYHKDWYNKSCRRTA